MLKEAIEAAGRKPYANEAEAEGTVLLKVLLIEIVLLCVQEVVTHFI